MIIATNVNKKFGKLAVLKNVNANCGKGQIISLIGPNGSGKTTFIKCLLGMVMPDSGFITFNQQNIAHDWHYRSRIGYMPQAARFPEQMTILQVFSMMKDIRKTGKEELDEELMEAFGLLQLGHKRMGTLSGGTRQKVSASLAFLFSPQVLILDEPTAGLDPVAVEVLKEKIRREKAKGKLMLITSHVLSEMDDLLTEVMYMQEGELLFHKSWSQLQADTGESKLTKAIARVMQGQLPA